MPDPFLSAETVEENLDESEVMTVAAQQAAPAERSVATASLPRNVKKSSRVQCDLCDKSFAQLSYLKAHQAVHLG